MELRGRNAKWRLYDYGITSPFFKYAVLEYNKTFDDIQNHWAQREIEKLALQQVVDGLTDSKFGPDNQVTRAQFVTLLARALKLTSSGDTTNFKDVASDAWYHEAVYAAYQAKIIKERGGRSTYLCAFRIRIQRSKWHVDGQCVPLCKR